MRRVNTSIDVVETGLVQVDAGTGVHLEIPAALAGQGDTRWRNITDNLSNVTGGSMLVRRDSTRVTLRLASVVRETATTSTTIITTLPRGFRPSADHVDWLPRDSYSWHLYNLNVQDTGFVRVVGCMEDGPYQVGWPADRPLSGQVTFACFEPWPSSMPGHEVDS